MCLLLACAVAPARGAEPAAGYRQLAASLRARLAGAATPTPAVAALAARITAGLADPRARALALSDWVRTHARHDDARIDLPGVAPHPAVAVLRERAGAPADSVLLLALLASSGIDGTAALVRQGPDDTLPDVPTATTFDRMLVYLPRLDLYLDPGAPDIAAGYLPPALLGKPVLLASGGFAMTPLAQAQGLRTLATVDVKADGSARVTLDRTYTGALAEPARQAARKAPSAARAPVAPVAPGMPQDLEHDTYRTSLSGIAAHGLAPPGTRTLATDDLAWSTIGAAVAGMRRDGVPGRALACPALDVEDDARYRLPPGLRVTRLPAPTSVIQGGVFYRASYARQGNAVLVRRRFTFRNGRPACSPADVAAMQPALARIGRDLRSHIGIAVSAAH